MTRSRALLGCVGFSLLLTGCPLTDPYQLVPELAGASGAAAAAGAPEAGTGAAAGGALGGAGAGRGGANGDSSDAGASDSSAGNGAASGSESGGAGALGEAGEASIGGAAIAGSTNSGGTSGSAGSAAGAGQAGSGGASGSAAGGDGGSAGCSPTCTGGLLCCGSACVDLSGDAQNCGACGKSCAAGRSCSGSSCEAGWVSVKAPPLALGARARAASVALGKSVFIWGGLDSQGNALDNGAIYTPKTDSWLVLPKATGSPSARIMASAVWTGSVVVMYGGTDATGNTVYRDGAVYDPLANAWTSLPSPPTGSTLNRRSAPFGYWDGTRAVFWGGLNASNDGVSGADRCDLTNWSNSGAAGDPGALSSPAWAVDGSTLYLQGGLLAGNRQDTVFSYTSSTDKWAALSKGLSARSGAFGAWDGSRFVVWGGRDDANLKNDGKSLSAGIWTDMSAAGAPSARYLQFRRSGWSFQIKPGVIALLGGQTSLSGGAWATDGASYDVGAAQWTPIGNWPSGESHEYGVGIWTGEEFVLWGGRDGNGPTRTGERWAP